MTTCANNAVVYSKPNCPQCVQAKTLLQTNNICYTEQEIGKDISLDDLFAKIGHPVRSAPQIFLNGSHVSTVMQLQQAIKELP